MRSLKAPSTIVLDTFLLTFFIRASQRRMLKLDIPICFTLPFSTSASIARQVGSGSSVRGLLIMILPSLSFGLSTSLPSFGGPKAIGQCILDSSNVQIDGFRTFL